MTDRHWWPRKPRPPSRVRPETPAPAPGHLTGGLEYTIRAWQCGCIILWDGDGRVTGTTPCRTINADEELEDILRDR